MHSRSSILSGSEFTPCVALRGPSGSERSISCNGRLGVLLQSPVF